MAPLGHAANHHPPTPGPPRDQHCDGCLANRHLAHPDPCASRSVRVRAHDLFAPPVADFGETLVLVLDYMGPAITASMTLRRCGSQSGGPVRAALQFDYGQAEGEPPENTPPGFEHDLPLPLRIIDTEQSEVLLAIGDSTQPVHAIHALAGCGKSVLLHCLVAMYALYHSCLPTAQRNAEVLLLTLRTRVLRHEFLQGLLKLALQPDQVIFGGRLPDRLQEAGVLYDDQAHFQNTVLGKAELP